MTPLEEYLYFDSLQKDSSADAATVLTLRGPFHLEAFKNAVHQVLTRSAYASAVVRTDDHGAIYWETTKLPEDSALFRCVPGDFDESACALEPLDITREPGIRFWIYSPEPDLTKVVFQFHHVMTDALGSFLFLDEILRLYAGIPLAERETPTLDAIQRSQKIRPTWQLWWSSLKQLLIWLQPWHRRPFRLRNPKVQVLQAKEAQTQTDSTAPITDSASPQSPQIKTRRLTFSTEATLVIRREAKTAGVTLNDWLLTRVFQALESWKQQTWPQKRNPLYRIAIPVSMRTDAHRDVTLGNIVSSVFLDQCSRACRQPFDVLLKQVAQGTRKQKQPHRRQFLLFELQGLHDFRAGKNDPRFGMRWFTSRSPHLETLVLSNLGVVLGTSQLPRTEDGRLRVGDLVLEDVFFVSPHTTGVALTIPAGTYAGKLRLHFCYDASQLTESDVQQLMKSIASTTPTDAFTID